MMRSGSILGALAIGALCMAGCAHIPEMHYYVLQPPDRPAPSTGDGATVGVRAFRVDPPYDQDRIVYRVGEDSTEIGFYAYHRWAAPLSRMLPGAVSDGLRDTPGLAFIEPLNAEREYDAYLSGRVLRFEEVDTAEGPEAHVEIDLTLRSPDGRQIWAFTVAARSVTPADEVAQWVEALAGELDRGLRAGQTGLARGLKALPDSPPPQSRRGHASEGVVK